MFMPGSDVGIGEVLMHSAVEQSPWTNPRLWPYPWISVGLEPWLLLS